MYYLGIIFFGGTSGTLALALNLAKTFQRIKSLIVKSLNLFFYFINYLNIIYFFLFTRTFDGIDKENLSSKFSFKSLMAFGMHFYPLIVI